ncbi:aryl-alcohol dehydrogenase [Faunimonas pinastri]|uniref:Aryl-alcohol dehydrogenase n=1 Tax=Faunimonas pinastri TaxID=1855383 RepID=A0A1H9E4C7_9HYPH|nr:NAD(P)-dependent alcohol dehydrogenase [Faunimonas pinastri]SEQ20485.1 aryl-alcohol dehydrogenase [Faunimonas pinastri]
MRITAALARAVSAPMSLEAVELDAPRADEVLVRLVATGICHTDMAMRDHKIYPIPHPAVLGHEGAGVVEQVGSAVTRVAPGDHVVLSFGSCGACPACADHRPSYCEHFNEYNFHGTRGDGTTPLHQHGQPVSFFQAQSSFATRTVCSERSVIKVPPEAPLDLLCPLGCAVQTGAGGVINSLGLAAGQSIAIFGTGSVGLCALMAAKMLGAGTIVAIDRSDERLALARRLGATHTVNTDHESVPDAMRRISAAGVDYTFETTANMALLRQATEILARRGVCGFVGGIPAGTEVTLDVEHMMTGGRTFRGIILGDSDPQDFIPRMAEAIVSGAFPIGEIVTRYPFSQINKAIADSLSGETVKAVLMFDTATTEAAA